MSQTYLARRTCPILAIYTAARADLAEWDRTLPHGPNDRIEVWPDVGHFLHQEQPEKLSKEFHSWLDTLRRPKPYSTM